MDSTDDVASIIGAFGAQLAGTSGSLALMVRFGVQEADVPRVQAGFAAIRTPTLAESGCLRFELNREARNPARFVVYERWRSLADLEAHLRTSYVAELRRQLDAVIVGVPEFHVLLPEAT
jgi:quinol monooxygenase YgiN